MTTYTTLHNGQQGLRTHPNVQHGERVPVYRGRGRSRKLVAYERVGRILWRTDNVVICEIERTANND